MEPTCCIVSCTVVMTCIVHSNCTYATHRSQHSGLQLVRNRTPCT